MIELDGTGYKSHITTLLHQPSDPPVIVEFLLHKRERMRENACSLQSRSRIQSVCLTYFDVQKVFAIERDGVPMHRSVFVDSSIVRNVRSYGERDRLVLDIGKEVGRLRL